jgi:hypothetical protein
MSSGSDWTDRVRRLAAPAPKLEIFLAIGFVLREDRGWRITESGRQFLASLERRFPPGQSSRSKLPIPRDRRDRADPGSGDASTNL